MTETWCIRINVTLSKFITEKSFLPLYRNSANRQIVPKIVQSMSHTITIHDGNKVGSRPKITPKKKTVLSFDMRILCVCINQWRKTNQFLRRWQCIKSKIGLHIWIESICFFFSGFLNTNTCRNEIKSESSEHEITHTKHFSSILCN